MSNEPKVDQAAPAYEVMRPRFAMANTLLGGTEAMRSAGQAYLPRYPEESEASWRRRLSVATLLNYYARTATELTSKVFSREIQIEEAPEWFHAFADDVDRAGNNLTTVARRWFTTGLTKGFAVVLVDHTQLAEGATRADEMAQGAGPYFVTIPPENLIAAYAEMINGREVFTHVRIRETITERQGFGEINRERIRVLEPGSWQLWEADDEGEWRQIDGGSLSLDFVPLAIWYAGAPDGTALIKPVLQDLAYLNVAHWQSDSDQRHCVSVARFPMLAGAGVVAEEVGKVVVGPNALLSTSDPQGRWYYVEPTGAAMEAGRADLEDLLNQMAICSIELQVKRTGNQTATAQAIQEGKATSITEDLAVSLADFIRLCAYYAGQWRGEEISPVITLNTDLGTDISSDAEVQALTEARKLGDISRPSYLRSLREKGVLPTSFDLDLNDEELTGEGPSLEPILAPVMGSVNVGE